METEDKYTLLNKAIDLTKNDGFHLYVTLRKIEQFGVWIESDTEISFISFSNIRDIRKDKRKGE
jgi:hypothetical protein